MLAVTFAEAAVPELSPAFEAGLHRARASVVEIRPLRGWSAAAMLAYVATALVVLGWAAAYAEPRVLGYAGLVLLAFSLFVRLYEEPHLTREFGEQYRDYCGRVGRWLPRLRRRSAA